MNMYTRVNRRQGVVTLGLSVVLSLTVPLAASAVGQAPQASTASGAASAATQRSRAPMVLAAAAPSAANATTPQASSRPILPISPEIEQRLPKIKQRLLSALPPGAVIEKIVQPEGAESITAIPAGTPIKLTVAGTLGPGQNVIQAVATITSRNADIGDAEVITTSMDPDNRTYFEFRLTATTAR